MNIYDRPKHSPLKNKLLSNPKSFKIIYSKDKVLFKIKPTNAIVISILTTVFFGFIIKLIF
jgi:hypothetical protein